MKKICGKTLKYIEAYANNQNTYALLSQVILVLLCFICYSHAIRGANFVFDDSPAVIRNKDVTTYPTNWTAIFSNDFWGMPLHSSESHKSYRPLTTLLFHIEYAIFKFNAAHMKLINLLIHCLNTILTWHVLGYFQFVHANRLATLSAVSFAVHPIHTEAVCGIVGRSDLLACLCYLLALLITLQDVDSYLGVIASIGLTAIGILFKETAATIPIACIFVHYMRCELYNRPFKIQLKFIMSLRYIAYALSALIITSARLLCQNFEEPKFRPVDNPIAFSELILTRVLSQQYLYVVNLWLLLCPQWLSFDWALGCVNLVTDIWDLRLQAVLAFYSLLIVACLNFRSCVNVMLGLGLLIIPFLPASGIIVKVGFVIAERVLYTPSIGFCLLFANGYLYCYQTVEKRAWLCAIMKSLYLLTITAAIIRTRQRSLDWLTEKQLYNSALSVCPNNAKVHYNIARLASDNLEKSKAFLHYHKAIELHPTYEAALMNLGNLYRDNGDLISAEKYLRLAIDAFPKFPAAWMNLGIVLAAQRKYTEAYDSYKNALKYRRNYAVCFYNIGNLQFQRNQYDAALQNWRRATMLNPQQSEAWANMLTLLENRTLYDDVLRLSEEALQYLPNEAKIMFIRANVLGKQNRYEEAETLFKHIISLSPANASYYTNLGVLYHRWNKTDAAIQNYQTAIKLAPNNSNTARLYLESLLKTIKVQFNT